jgi:hypothetical protein
LTLGSTIDPSNSNTIYVGVFQKVFKSTDGGVGWTATNLGGIPNTSVQTLAIDSFNTNTIYAGTTDYGIFKSTDGGKNWFSLNNGLPDLTIYKIVIDPLNTNTLYTVAGKDVVKTTNGGASWVVLNAAPHGIDEILAIDPANTNMIYARTRKGVFKSTDGGVSWGIFNEGLGSVIANVLAIDPFDAGTIYAGTDAGVFQRQSKMPNIFSATFDTPKKLTISGNTFGTSPGVIINNQDRTAFIVNASDSSIQLKGKGKKLGLRQGDNTIQVISTQGIASNVLILKL